MFSEDIQSKGRDAFKNKFEGNQLHYFRQAFWPIINQMGVSYDYNPITGIVKTVCAINLLKSNGETTEYVDNYLAHLGLSNIWQLIRVFMDIINKVWDDINKGVPKPYLKIESDLKSAFEGISLGDEDTILKSQNSSVNLKEFPLFNTNEGEYVVFDWNFFINKIHDAFIFDYYKYSEISKSLKFPNFPLFKQFIGLTLYERFMLRKIIKVAFGKHAVIKYDKDNDKVFPDAYVRKGKNIFLFEIKDSLFAHKALVSNDFETVKNEIDRKYNSRSKGTGQILKQIKHLQHSSYEDRSFQELGLKHRNLVIYPVIIYTDYLFQTNGISFYLQNELRQRVNEIEPVPFQDIKPLSFIGLNFIIERLSNFESDKNYLSRLIHSCSQEIRRREKLFNKNSDIEKLQKLNQPFETIAEQKGYKISRSLSSEIFKSFGLSDNLDN